MMTRRSLIALLALMVVCGSVSAQEAPYPPSPVIASVEFDFETEHVFGAGSDQWPLTWAADGDLYAAWGDGFGWSLKPPKYSMGVTRIGGLPPDLEGEDRWGIGPGAGFYKPEALVAVDKTLVMFWTRGDSKSDTDNTASAVSQDDGKTWALGEGKAFPDVPDGFRVRGICQFGPGYEGAVDEFVYVYFGMNRASDLYLARVPKGRLLEAERYEWFTGLSDDGTAGWSASFADRRPAFHDPAGYVWHVGVSYHPGLERYLLTKPHYAVGDDRQVEKVGESGVASFGMFDAPSPWGPWTTVAYQDNFKDDLVKFSYFVPTKFLGAEDTTFWLAWSGWPEYDSVSFVKGTFRFRE